jgi:exopolyphosphatase / guanosine-5'-triphosphate,3'-diphosphate pyrophosphatase
MRYLLLVTLVPAIFVSCQSTPKCGSEVRAAFDVGSSSTKIKVVEFNTCIQDVTQTLLEDQAKVDYRDALEKNTTGEFSESIQADGIAALEKLKEEAQAKGAKKYTAVATAAFRQAKNAASFVNVIREKLAIPVRIITQSDEALLGFQAAREKAKTASQDLVVWDIGGGSMQMVSIDDTVKPTVYYGQLASVSFKNQVIAKIQMKDPTKVSSPNPLMKKQIQPAVALAENEAKAAVPSAIQKKFLASETLVVGIGGVLAKSLPRQMPASNVVTQENVKTALDRRANMTDAQINDLNAATEVTNLALVFGFMKALGIKSYQPAEVSLVDALWADPLLW